MDSDRYKKPHKIVIRQGKFYLTSFVDKHGNPRTAIGSPGFMNRKECEDYGDRLRDKPSTPDEVFEEIESGEEEAPAIGGVIRTPETAELNIDSSPPDVVIEPTQEAPDGQESNSSETEDPVG